MAARRVEEIGLVGLVREEAVLADAVVVPRVRRGDRRHRVNLPVKDPLPDVKVRHLVMAIGRQGVPEPAAYL